MSHTTSATSDMRASDFLLDAPDGAQLFVRSFLPEGKPKALLNISHGMAEHSARYARFAAEAVAQGYAVYAHDHRGHGKTARSERDLGYFADADGWDRVVDDLGLVLSECRSRHPDVPHFLMGHSMGSYIARCYVGGRGQGLAGFIISGTTHDSPALFRASRVLARLERLRLGPRSPSRLIEKLTLEAFNKAIEGAQTDCDWLSRDPDEVAKYVNDPLCGFSCTTQMWVDVFTGMYRMCSPATLRAIPRELPIHIVSGELDPVHNRLRGIRMLRKALERAGVQNVTCRIYPGARHELLNETNRDEVTRDLLDWLASC